VVALALDSQYCMQYWLIKGEYPIAIFHTDRNSELIDADRPVLEHGPRSLTCMRVNEFVKLTGEMKVIDEKGYL